MSNEIRIEYMSLSKLEGWPGNPKKHEGEKIDRSVERFGFVQPITIDESTKRIVAGHGRLESIKRLREAGKKPPLRVKVVKGDWQVPVIRGVSFQNEQEAEAYLVADNRLVEVGGWDEAALRKMLEGLPSLEGVGFDESEFKNLAGVAVDSISDERGLTPDERSTTFVSSAIRQIVLYLSAEEYEKALGRLEQVMKDRGILDNTAAILFLLQFYEDHRSQA